MANALNFVFPLKQDSDTQARLRQYAEIFGSQIQPVMEEALRRSKIVHSARVFVIENKYIVLALESDAPWREYGEFFRRALPQLFAPIFPLAEGAPNYEDSTAFHEYLKTHNVRSLGSDPCATDGEPAGYCFLAFGQRTVQEISSKLED